MTQDNTAAVVDERLRDRWYARDRLGGLRRFAIAITILNVLGHTWLGFEQSWAHPLAALATAYGMELLLEWLDASVQRRKPRFYGGAGRRRIGTDCRSHGTEGRAATVRATPLRL